MPVTAIDRNSSNGPTIQPSDIAQMASDLFVSMLDMSFDANPIDIPTSHSIQSTVWIRGEWNAELRVCCSKFLATRIARAMYLATEEELSTHTVQDVLGEVANVIGGNIKGIVNADCSLSLPCVGRILDDKIEKGIWLTFQCEESPITIALIEH